jgi:hypothetical protein
LEKSGNEMSVPASEGTVRDIKPNTRCLAGTWSTHSIEIDHYPKDAIMRFAAAVRTFASSLALSCVIFVQTSTAISAEDNIAAARRLPPGVLLFLTCPDISAAVDQIQDTSFAELVHDEAMQEFRQQLINKFEDFKNEAEGKLEFSFSDITSLLEGEFSIAVVRPVGQTPGALAIIEIGDHEDLLDQMLLKAEESFDKEKIEKETETIEGTEVVTCKVVISDKEDAEPATFAYFVKDGMFVVGSGASLLESVLQRWDGKHEQTLASNEIYEHIMKKCSPNPRIKSTFSYFVDPVGLVATGMAMAPQTQLFAGMVYVPTFGLSSLKAIGGAMELASGEYDSISRSIYYVDGPVSGVLKIFEFRPTASAPPSWVPADADQYFTFDWNIKGAYEAVESIYDSFTGPGKFAAMVDGLAQQGTGLHLKNDVIDVLTGKFQGYVMPNAEDPSQTRFGLSIGTAGKEKAQKLVDAVFEATGGVETSDYDGLKLYVPSEEGKPGAAVVKDDSIFLSNSSDDLKLALSGKSESPLAKSAAYAPIAKIVPENVNFLVHQNPADQMEAGYKKLREGEFDGLIEGAIDFSTLPPFEKIRKYFLPNTSYIVPSEKGAMGVQFVLKRKQ